MKKNDSIYLRNTTGADISFSGAANTFSIQSLSNGYIWNPNDKNSFLNFSNVLEQEWIFARDVGNGDLVMYINGVEQTSDFAFYAFHELKTYYNSLDGYTEVYHNVTTSLNDGQVRLSASDNSPNYLSNKLLAGTNVTISEQTGSLVISSTGGGQGSGNSFSTLTDGTNNAVASGEDTFRFRSANNILTTLITPADATYGDNLLLTVNQSNIDHGSISGLSDDDHTQYLLANGTRSMSGSLNMGNFNITNVGTVGGYTLSTFVPNTITITAGSGLTGGGDLSSNKTIDVVANADGSIVVNANDIQVGVISDSQHGTRGGGTTHSTATTSVDGFMSSTDKTKLDQVVNNSHKVTISATQPTSPSTGDIWIVIA